MLVGIRGAAAKKRPLWAAPSDLAAFAFFLHNFSQSKKHMNVTPSAINHRVLDMPYHQHRLSPLRNQYRHGSPATSSSRLLTLLPWFASPIAHAEPDRRPQWLGYESRLLPNILRGLACQQYPHPPLTTQCPPDYRWAHVALVFNDVTPFSHIFLADAVSSSIEDKADVHNRAPYQLSQSG